MVALGLICRGFISAPTFPLHRSSQPLFHDHRERKTLLKISFLLCNGQAEGTNRTLSQAVVFHECLCGWLHVAG